MKRVSGSEYPASWVEVQGERDCRAGAGARLLRALALVALAAGACSVSRSGLGERADGGADRSAGGTTATGGEISQSLFMLDKCALAGKSVVSVYSNEAQK